MVTDAPVEEALLGVTGCATTVEEPCGDAVAGTLEAGLLLGGGGLSGAPCRGLSSRHDAFRRALALLNASEAMWAL